MQSGEVWEASLARGRPQGDPLRDLESILEGEWVPHPGVLLPAPTPNLFPSTWPPLVALLPMFLNSEFYHRNLPFCSANSFPRASKREHSLKICLGRSPVPRHLLLPGSENIPQPFCFPGSLLSYPHGAQPSAPFLASEHGCPGTP